MTGPTAHGEIRAALLAASSPEAWLIGEIGEFLFDDIADSDERARKMDALIERLELERAELSASRASGSDILEFTVLFGEADGSGRRITFRTLPSPALLLDMCASAAELDEAVVVRHLYANGLGCEFKRRWPFGMAEAVSLTAPMADALAEDEEADVSLDSSSSAAALTWGPGRAAAAWAGFFACALAAAAVLRRRRESGR